MKGLLTASKIIYDVKIMSAMFSATIKKRKKYSR